MPVLPWVDGFSFTPSENHLITDLINISPVGAVSMLVEC